MKQRLWRQNLMQLASLAALWAFWPVSSVFAFPTQDDVTVGNMALNFGKQTKMVTRLDLGVVDASITSSPPDATKVDRRLESMSVLGADAVFNNRFGLRLYWKALYSKRRQLDEDAPRIDMNETMTTHYPSADFTFVTDKGLEIFAGIMVQHRPAYKQKFDAKGIKSETRFKSSSVISRRFGAVRRSQVFAGGFYYEMGDEERQSFKKVVSDGSTLSGSDKIFLPSRLGVFGFFGAFGSIFDFELAFVQARGMGPEDEKGSTIYTDHFEARLGFQRNFASNLGFKISAAHKTLSYANNGYVNLDTMPMSSGAIHLLSGSPQNKAYAGLIYGQGEDGQSIPEFNARYKMKALALSVGGLFSW